MSSVGYVTPDLISFASTRYFIPQTDCLCLGTGCFICVNTIISNTATELVNHPATCYSLLKLNH